MITFDFEKPLVEHEKKIAELRAYAKEAHIDVSPELASLERKRDQLCAEIYANLTPYQKVLVARHPNRPYTLDYVRLMCQDFLELHGDRRFADDLAMVGGFATIAGRRIVLIGHQKGRDTKENLKRNFGMAHPEGYRKALRLMELADRCRLPIVTFIDTPGAYPGIGAEERGQAEAIAVNLREMIGLGVPIICIVIGEGGSGGALGIGVGNRVLILEHAYYSVISPEGCAAILFHDSSRNQEAANALKLTAQDLLSFGIVEEIIPEPLGGAHRNHEQAAALVKDAILRHLDQLASLSPDQLREQRYQKYRAVGVFTEAQQLLAHPAPS
ncbi:MAG: acetyl-CoA carboxylase carboxyltransferase subunit alpha [bacterium]|nr:acetyl-CoA carboxylase carboxyltransferase subunit alpha [bacterium]